MIGRFQKGFTIIELLIVIVVIAVLATVVTVTFRGVQQKANNTQTIQALASYVKAIRAYAVDYGTYPQTNSCMGEEYEDGRCLGSLPESSCYGLGRAWANTTFHDALRPYMGGGQLPMPSTQPNSCNGSEYVGAYYYRNTTTGVVTLIAILRGDGECPNIGGAQNVSRVVGGDGMRCSYSMAAP